MRWWKLQLDIKNRKKWHRFFQFLLQKTEDIHKNDTQMPDDPEILDAYDPTRGVSYNFTPHGGQIRNLPKYKIQGDTQIAQILFWIINTVFVFNFQEKHIQQILTTSMTMECHVLRTSKKPTDMDHVLVSCLYVQNTDTATAST